MGVYRPSRDLLCQGWTNSATDADRMHFGVQNHSGVSNSLDLQILSGKSITMKMLQRYFRSGCMTDDAPSNICNETLAEIVSKVNSEMLTILAKGSTLDT